jgi:hypothetical protein
MQEKRVMGVMREARQLGWLAAMWLAACVSTNLPEPARGSPLSPQAEAAPVTPVATSLTSDPLATVPPPAQYEHEHHHHDHTAPAAEEPAAHGGGMVDTAPPRASPAHGQRAARAPEPPPGMPAADGGERAASEVYVCPMHPDVRQTTPGNCPRCGMKLVPAPKPAPKPHEHHGE